MEFEKILFHDKYKELEERKMTLLKEIVKILKNDYDPNTGISYLPDDLMPRYSENLKSIEYGAYEKLHKTSLIIDECTIFKILRDSGVINASDDLIGRCHGEGEEKAPPFNVKVNISALNEVMEIVDSSPVNYAIGDMNKSSVKYDFPVQLNDIRFSSNLVYCNGEERSDLYKKGFYERKLDDWKKVNIKRKSCFSLIIWLYNQNKENKFITLDIISKRIGIPIRELQKVPYYINKELNHTLNFVGDFLESGYNEENVKGWRINPRISN